MTTQRTTRISPQLIRRLRVAWLLLASYIFITWLPRVFTRLSNLPTDDGLTLLSRVVEIFTFVAFAAVAVTLYRLRGDDWMALFTGMLLLLTAGGYTAGRPADPVLGLATFWLLSLMETFQVVFFYIFPDGKFLPRWVKYGVVPFLIFRLVIWENIYRNNLPQGALEVGIVVLILLVGIGTQIYRYRRHANAVQRQQVKWLLVGFSATILLVAPSIYIISVFEGQSRAVVGVVMILRTLALLIVPLSLGISITRYRLWDLDLTINRSVVGAAVCVTLAVIAGAVFGMMHVATSALMGESPTLILCVVALVAAGLMFRPVHRRIRHFVDVQLYDFRFDLNELRRQQTPPKVNNPGALTGRTIGQYEILDVLGRGGMGEVYKGYDGERVVAVKIMPREIASDEKNAERFEREIEALKALAHPNVVRLIDSGVHEGMRYMVIDYIEGRDVTHTLREQTMFSEAAASDIIRQISGALAYIHEQGQVHRDVTSGNIMLSPDGDNTKAILMDFGLVKLLSRPSSITMSGDVMGTIDYMAPEQIVQTQTVDHRSDIYALGVVFYELLTGKKPFSGGPAQVLFAHLYQPPPDVRLLLPDVSTSVSAAIMRALSKTPDERFQSIGDFVAALDAAPISVSRAA